MKSLLPWIALCCVATAVPASAQTVWRCGPEGRIFSDRPCSDGESFAINARVPAKAAAEAQSVKERERRSLEKLAAQRRSREADGRQAGAGGIRPETAAPAAATPPRRQSPVFRP